MAWDKSTMQSAEEIARQEKEIFGEDYHNTLDLSSEEAKEILERVLFSDDQLFATYDYAHDDGNRLWEKHSRICMDNDQIYQYELDGYTNVQTLRMLSVEGTVDRLTHGNYEITDLGKAFVEDNATLGEKPAPQKETASEKTPNKELDFSDTPVERYSPEKNDCYVFHPDKDLLEQLFERVSDTKVEIIVEGFASLQDAVDCKNKEVELLVYLNEEHEFESAKIELVECDVSVPYLLAPNEQESCMKAIEKYEQDFDKQAPKKEQKGVDR